MLERAEELKQWVRETPLNNRLDDARRRIGKMCSEGRPPRMTIPVQYDDDDFYISTTLSDAQAMIATLTQQIAHANEQLRLYRASADDACGLRQQVAQLTAELDAHIETSKKLFSQMVGMKTDLNDAQVDLTRWQVQYHALIMAVGKKYPGETRHQTALRYIKQAEDKSELRSALELCVARLEGLKEDGITQAEQQALDAANTALDARAAQIERGE